MFAILKKWIFLKIVLKTLKHRVSKAKIVPDLEVAQ